MKTAAIGGAASVLGVSAAPYRGDGERRAADLIELARASTRTVRLQEELAASSTAPVWSEAGVAEIAIYSVADTWHWETVHAPLSGSGVLSWIPSHPVHGQAAAAAMTAEQVHLPSGREHRGRGWLGGGGDFGGQFVAHVQTYRKGYPKEYERFVERLVEHGMGAFSDGVSERGVIAPLVVLGVLAADQGGLSPEQAFQMVFAAEAVLDFLVDGRSVIYT